MKILVLFGSTLNSTKRVVEKFTEQLHFPFHIINVKELNDDAILQQYQLLIFFCPTYGDEELQEDMENFLLICEKSLEGKLFAVCELGNHEGYEDFSFGASRLVRKMVLALGATEFIKPLSMDSLPRKDWMSFTIWSKMLNESIEKHLLV